MIHFRVYIVFVIIIPSILAALSFTEPKVHPDYPGQCYEENMKKAFKVGEILVIPGQCVEASCRSDFSIQYSGCGVSVIGNGENCKIVEDSSLPYPECCPIRHCDI